MREHANGFPHRVAANLQHLGQFLFDMLMIRVGLLVTAGEELDTSKVLSTDRLGPYLLGSLLMTLLVVVGFILCIIPGILVLLFGRFFGGDDEEAPLVQGHGSGFIMTADGIVITNNHVVDGSETLVVRLQDGREFDGTVVESDTDRDLAVVKIDGSDLPTAELGSSKNLEVGQLVIAIGSPLGQFTNSVTSGVLSAIGREIQVPDEQTGRVHTLSNLLQTDAAINPGNSGGPLLDEHGKIIGINTAVAGGANGIGFAIPIDDAADILAAAMGASQS